MNYNGWSLGDAIDLWALGDDEEKVAPQKKTCERCSNEFEVKKKKKGWARPRFCDPCRRVRMRRLEQRKSPNASALRKFRVEQSMTMRDVAERAKVSINVIRRLEWGLRLVAEHEVKQFSLGYGISENELRELCSENVPDPEHTKKGKV